MVTASLFQVSVLSQVGWGWVAENKNTAKLGNINQYTTPFKVITMCLQVHSKQETKNNNEHVTDLA